MKLYIVLEKKNPSYSTDKRVAEQAETIQFLMLVPVCASASPSVTADLHVFDMHENVENCF